MLGFNAILRDADIDPGTVKLLRHQDRRAKRGATPFDSWCARDGRLEAYQALQHRPVFVGMQYVASFVATPANETLFIGLYEVNGHTVAPAGTLDPITKGEVGGHLLYDLSKSERLSQYDGRIVIDWGLSFISWAQNAKTQDKPIIEIKREVGEPPFPGYMPFFSDLDALAGAPPSWQTALRVVKGVYLLVCLKTGMQYVGSASGPGGFWERWESYRQNGHGGNEALKLDPHLEYQVSILETAPSSAMVSDIIAIENRWKEKLRSRDEYGLNYPESAKWKRRSQAIGKTELVPDPAAPAIGPVGVDLPTSP